jgi:hypothetical protein
VRRFKTSDPNVKKQTWNLRVENVTFCLGPMATPSM